MKNRYNLIISSSSVGRGIVKCDVSGVFYIVDAVDAPEILDCSAISINQILYDEVLGSNYKFINKSFDTFLQIEDYLRVEWLKHFISQWRLKH